MRDRLWRGGVVRPGGELDELEAKFEVDGVGVGEVCVGDGSVGRLPFNASGRQSVPELLSDMYESFRSVYLPTSAIVTVSNNLSCLKYAFDPSSRQ